MLACFESLTAPEVRYAEIFRDHADPHRFYVLPSRPRIAVDEKTNLPLFNYTLFSRNIEIAYASAGPDGVVESQLGALNMTVDLSIPDEDFEKIRGYLSTSVLTPELGSPSTYNKLFKNVTTKTEPEIAYANTWQQGTVKLDMLEEMGGTFKRSSSKETKPLLGGSNTASLWATFGTEGAQLLWDMLNREPPPDADPAAGDQIPLQANISYQLEGYSRAPALYVHVHADGGPVYEEIRKRTQVFERVGGSWWSYPQISELTKSLVDSRNIEITWEDYGIPDSDPQAGEIKNQLQTMVMNAISNQIMTLFFAPHQIKGLQEEDLGKTFTHTRDGIPGSRLWLNEYTEEQIMDIDFTINQTQNFMLRRNPATSLFTNLTRDQIEKLVRIVDVGSPEVRVMSVPIYTNADFAGDKIANITTTISYKQFDTLIDDWVEKSESFVFKTGQENFVFRTRLARDEAGKLIDKYDAKAQINYIGTSQSPPPIEMKNISEQALTFSYDKLGYINVTVQAGDIDWEQLKEVYVDLVYDAASSNPDAKATVTLKPDKLEGRWNTSKHGQTSNKYSYTVRYKFKDGTERSGKKQTDERGTLVIHDALVGRLRRNFDVNVDPQTVQNLTLKVRYENPPSSPDETRNVFAATGTWQYVRPLEENGSQNLKYNYIVQYTDNVVDSPTDWKLLQGGDDDPPPITARRYRINVMVDGEGVDWEKWRTVILNFEYHDPDGHPFEKYETIRFTKDTALQNIEVLAFSPQARSYDFSATFVPRDSTEEPVTVPADGSTVKKTGALLLETLV